MGGKKDLEDLASQVAATPGWESDKTTSGHWQFTSPGNEQVIVSYTPGSIRTLANAKAELRRKGWDEEAAKRAKDDKRVERLAADKELEAKMMDAALKKAASEALKKASEDDLEQQLLQAEAVKPNPVVNPFLAAPVALANMIKPEEHMAPNKHSNPFPASARDRDKPGLYWVTPDMADKALEKGPCRQRTVYDTNVAKIKKAMETGRFLENEVDRIAFDIHGCCSNGQHRLFSVLDADPDQLAKHYPNGVPMHVVFGIDPEDIDVIDTGRSRSVKDALDVDGLPEFGNNGSAVLRLIMNYDSGVPWTGWNHNVWTNDEFRAAARGGLRDVKDYLAYSQKLNRKAKLVKTVGAAASFLMDRDNPEGGGKEHPERTNEEFWAGVCFEVALEPDDPRAALYKFLTNLKDDRNRKVPTPVILGHVLRQYANWHLNMSIVNSRQDDDWPMPQVWQPGMRFINGQLRHPQRVVNNRTKK
jgi:hypothetical protein